MFFETLGWICYQHDLLILQCATGNEVAVPSLFGDFPNVWTVCLRGCWPVGWRHTVPGCRYREWMVMRVTVQEVNSVRPQWTIHRRIWRPGHIMKAIIQVTWTEMSVRGQVSCGAKGLNRFQPQGHAASFGFHSPVLEPDLDGCFREVKRWCQLTSASAGNVVFSQKFLLESAELLASECCPVTASSGRVVVARYTYNNKTKSKYGVEEAKRIQGGVSWLFSLLLSKIC